MTGVQGRWPKQDRVALSAALVVGLVAGLAVAAKTFTGTMLLNWDQVIGGVIPVPPGQYGSGLELPRRVPFYTLLAPFSRAVPGPAVVGVVVTLSVTAAVVGVVRLCRPGNRLMTSAFALVYGLSPFILTRTAMGHLPLVVAAALLPWMMVSLSQHRRPTVIVWSAVYALTGSSGAVLGLVPIVVHLLGESRGRWMATARRLAAVALAQSIWVIPGLVAVWRGVPLPVTAASAFTTRVEDVSDLVSLVVGGGFFVRSEDVAAGNPWSVVLGLVLVLFALAFLVLMQFAPAVFVPGRHDPDAAPTAATGVLLAWSGAVGAVLVIAPAIPGLDRLFGLAGWGPLGVFRETQKFWPLAFLSLAFFSVRGLSLLSNDRRTVSAISALATVGLVSVTVASAWSGLWGAGGRLEAYDPPAAWTEIEQVLSDEPGNVVVFPWRRYERLDLSQGRNVLQPAPWLLTERDPNSIFVSGNPGLEPDANERGEPLEAVLADLDVQVRGGFEIGPQLQAAGVRWLLIEGSPDAKFYRRLANEPQILAKVEVDDYLLYAVVPAGEGSADGGANSDPIRSPPPLAMMLALAGAVPTVAALGLGARSARR